MPSAIPAPVLPAAGLRFLADLGGHNTTAWFVEHKAEYENLVLEPFRRLAEALIPAMRAIDPEFVLHPGNIVSRIRRDVRFSADKSPFRTTQWIAFKRRSKEWTSRPAFFMEIGPELYRHGMGFYSAGTRGMAALRELAGERPREYAAALKKAQAAGYALAGDVYKRPRLPEGLAECVQELHRRRNVFLMREADPQEALDNPGLAGELERCFCAAAPMYRLWLEAAGRAAGQPAG